MPNASLRNVVPLNGAVRRPGGSGFGSGSGAGARSAAPALVPYPRWQTACERVSGALLGGERLVLVVGPAGTGKSLLLEQTARVMRAAGWSTVLRQADPTPPPDQPGTNLLLVDEADRLEPGALRRLTVTANGPLVLAGLDSLATRVPGVPTIALPALGREEARDYIAQWLALTGRSPAHLETPGMRRLVELSGGVPRLISTLLSAAAWLAKSAGESVMTQQHVEESAALRSSLGAHEPEPATDAPEPRRARGVLTAAWPAASAMLLVGAAAFLAGRYFPGELREAAGGAGRAIAHWQGDLQSRIDLALWSDPVEPSPAPSLPPPQTAAQTAQSTPPSVKMMAQLPPPAAPEPAPPPLAPIVQAPEPAAVVVQKALGPIPDPIAPPEKPSPAPDAESAPPTIGAAPVVAEPAAPSRLASATVTPAEPRRAAKPALSSEIVDLLVRRGRDMLALGDVSAARLLLGRAADAGSADAMFTLAQTYDPTVITQSKLMLAPDRAEAGRWYRRSAAAGNKEAEAALQRLGS